MPPLLLMIVLLVLATGAFQLARRKAFALAGRPGGGVKLHSKPGYHGALAALWCALPALLILALWLALEPQIITHLVVGELPESIRSQPPDRLNLVVNDIRNLESGAVHPRPPIRRWPGPRSTIVRCGSSATRRSRWSPSRPRWPSACWCSAASGWGCGRATTWSRS